MGVFDDIPVRSNAQTVDASWWNAIRTALIDALGAGETLVTQFTILDNQSAYVDITGLDFDADDYSWVKIQYSFYRTDGTTHRRETGFLELEMVTDGEAWRIADRRGSTDSLNMGVDSLNINQTGDVAQVRYKSDSMGGTYVGKGLFKVVDTMPRES